MPSLNKQWSQERLGVEDFPVDIAGFSKFMRSFAPYTAKPGDVRVSRRGKSWFFGKAAAAIAAPTETPCSLTLTVDANGFVTGQSIGTAGTGYQVGELLIPGTMQTDGSYLEAKKGVWKVTTVSAAGGVTGVSFVSQTSAFTAAATGMMPAAAAFTLCDVSDAFNGLVAAGTAYKSYTATDIGEFGWFEKV